VITMRKIKYFASELSPKMDGMRVRVAGWATRIRDLGNIVFIRVRDREGEFQIICKKGEVDDSLLKLAKKITPASAIIAEGILRIAKNKEGFEIVPEKLYGNIADSPLPIDIFQETTELDKRIDYRTLDLRILKHNAIFRIKSIIANAFREYLLKNGFVEIHTPAIGLYVAEGGANVFEVKYFDKKAYLRQSPQIYKQLMTGALEKVFEVGPAFRAEPSYTIRHLTEFISLDVEMAWIRDIEDLLDLLEDILIYIFKRLDESGRKFFNILGVEPPKIPKKPFPVMSYREALMILNNAGVRLEGKDIPQTGEKVLWKFAKENYNSDFLFITDYPWEIRPFYAMKYEKIDNRLGYTPTKSMDLLYRGMEIVTGGQREHRYDVLKRQIIEKGLRPEAFGYYLDMFRFGMPPHGGFAIGLDRLTMMILNLSNLREAVLYPRDPNRLEP